jgi:hypothetical protein
MGKALVFERCSDGISTGKSAILTKVFSGFSQSLQEGQKDVDWINLARDGYQMWDLLNTIMNIS